MGWGGVRNEPLNNASASGTHDHRCRLQLFCFLANYLTRIPFNNPSHSPHLFHIDHLNLTIKILKATTVGNGQIFKVENLSIKPVSDKLRYIYIWEIEGKRKGGRSYIYLATVYPIRLSVVITEVKEITYLINEVLKKQRKTLGMEESAYTRFPLVHILYKS
jgi:hypothetical protein